MAVYLLDSTLIVDALNEKRGRADLIDRLVREGNFLACCAINVGEVYAGMRPAEAGSTEKLLGSFSTMK